jgi:hypothetical protein
MNFFRCKALEKELWWTKRDLDTKTAWKNGLNFHIESLKHIYQEGLLKLMEQVTPTKHYYGEDRILSAENRYLQ